MNLLIINGPNLNLLGKREPSIYGSETFDDYLSKLSVEFADDSIDYFQSNSEGDIINKIHSDGFSVDGLIINAGAYTHTSVAIADAISAIQSPVIEVHISNVHKREAYRHKSFLSAVCLGVIAGFGLDSYRLAIEAFKKTV
ncbi:type II 3-dehydroquinate dehydratase [Carboxylicivirga marina]|uniref:3-dehydroquinate dehydratase n=1 Tax=Carboxylicivirga marina TaxID=2800988 RepID=A0ABS1HRB4_9BACT|nr:type II 3-dehydroquinate dehydratase [Carboxylicivirga marina]MBK3519793.1 type II 3-dehydroquinate dehydratase [Carboxylicivirga marina]